MRNAREQESVLAALAKESEALIDRSLTVFLEYDFLEHTVLGGRLTGGHVITYLAREADRMADELLAATGRPVPAPDRGRQWGNEEGGNLRPGAVLIDDLNVSAERLGEAITAVQDWSALPLECQEIPPRRLVQVAVHHADLGRPWDELATETAEILVAQLPVVLAAELAGFRLRVDSESREVSGTYALGAATLVSGPVRQLVAWATGRTARVQGIPDDVPRPSLRVWI